MMQMKLEIKFEDCITEEEADKLLNCDWINKMLSMHGVLLRLYQTDINSKMHDIIMNDPTKPHAFITAFTKEDGKWYGEVKVPEPYLMLSPIIETAYIKPIILGRAGKPINIIFFETGGLNILCTQKEE